MKKTTLLIIGAVAFVLQSASAQVILYSDNFEGQTLGAAPQVIGTANNATLAQYQANGSYGPGYPGNVGGGDAGFGPEAGGAMWNWVGGGGNGVSDTVWQTASVLDSSGFFNTQALQFGWTDDGNAGSYFGFSTQNGASYALGGGSASDQTFSFDIQVSGTEFAASTSPVTIWFDQFPGGVKSFDASYAPTIATDGSWNHVVFSLDELGMSGTSGAFDPTLGIEIAFDGGTGADQLGGDTALINIDNVLLESDIPEPGTIALLTLGGLGALVAVRRRRA